METILRFINGLAWERMIVALLHSLWQGAILAVAVWALLRGISASRARLRYGIAVAGLFAALVATMATLQWRGGSPNTRELHHVSSVAGAPDLTRRNFAPAIEVPSTATRQSAPAAVSMQRWTWAALLWLGGTLVMLGRAAWSLIGAGRLLRSCRFIEDEPLTRAVDRLKRTMGIARPVRLATGPAIHVPAVLGTLVPVILLPLAVMNEMPVAHLQMILAHELAHVRRHDYLINLLQLLIEALLFFNPAIWWLSRQIRIEREACCDAAAIAATGSGSDYARSLAEIMASILGTQAGLQVTPAIQGDGGIVDRVRRVLSPTWRPMVRLPWYSLMGTTAVAIVLLIGMWGGTHVVVRAAEDLLTPAERVQKMAQLQDDLGAIGGLGTTQPAREYLLTGSVKTGNGQPLPPHVYLQTLSQSIHSSAFSSVSIDKHGNFSCKLEGNMARVWGSFPGFAPVFSEILKADASGKFPPVKFVLESGFDQTVHVTDQEGHPVGNVRLPAEYKITMGSSGSASPRDPLITDADGAAVIHHTAEAPMSLTVDVPGFEYDVISLKPEAGKEQTITLTSAKPTTGVITDQSTGEPVGGVSILLMQRVGFDDRTWLPHSKNNGPVLLTKTDAQGHFTLDTLRVGCQYTLWITAADHGARMIRGVMCSQTDLAWALGPPRSIAVQIHAPAGGMPKAVNVSNPFTFENTTTSEDFSLPIKVKDGVGTAVFADPIPGTVRFSVGDQQVKLNTENPVGPAVLNLNAGTKARALRTVVLKFDAPKDSPAPIGKVRISYCRNTDGPWEYKDVPIVDGQATLSIPAPEIVSYAQSEIAGYSITDQNNNVTVPEGSEPFLISIPVTPAGAIHGMVLNEADKPVAEYFYVQLVTVQQPPMVNGKVQNNPQSFNNNEGSGRYLLSPIPLGGTYRAVAVSGARVAVSDEITIDADHSIAEANLKFAAGEELSGTVLQPDGSPAQGLKIELDIQPLSNSSASQSITTDRNGRFVFEHIDPKAADYNVNVIPTGSTQGAEVKHIAFNGTPLQIQLKPGVVGKCRIIDSQTGKPMAGVTVTLLPVPSGGAEYTQPINAAANQDGELEVHDLEPIEYSVNVINTFSPNAVVKRDNAGKATGVEEAGAIPTVKLKGGQEDVVEVRRTRSPW